MRNLANLIHMTANHRHYFPHWSLQRYARMWMSFNVKEAILCAYYPG